MTTTKTLTETKKTGNRERRPRGNSGREQVRFTNHDHRRRDQGTEESTAGAGQQPDQERRWKLAGMDAKDEVEHRSMHQPKERG